MMERVLVTGAGGFIGSHLIEKLHAQGAYVIALDDLSVGKLENLEANFDCFLEKDLAVPENVENLPKVDYVYHFAAPCSIIMFKRDNTNQLINSTLNGFYNILNYCKKNNVKKLIWASSATYYGNSKGKLTEDRMPNPANVYGYTKVASEHLMNLFKDVNHVGLRIFPAYGGKEEHKGTFASVPYLFLKDMLQGITPVIWGDGTQARDFIYISDLVDLIVKAGHKDTSPYLNLGTGQKMQFNTLVKEINRVIGTNIAPKYMPNPYANSYLHSFVADTTLMKKELGIANTSIKEGLQLTAEWIKRKVLHR